MKIFIAQSYFRVLDPKEEHKNMPYPPLGTIIMATYLAKLGYDIHFYDCMIASNAEDIYDEINKFGPDILLLYDDEFNYVTKMSLLNMRDNTYEIIEYVKSKNIMSIVYTSDAIDHPELYLHAGADVIIIGEGETVVEDIFTSMETSESRFRFSKEVLGIAYFNDKILIHTKKKPLRSDLDELPDPDFARFSDLPLYKVLINGYHRFIELSDHFVAKGKFLLRC